MFRYLTDIAFLPVDDFLLTLFSVELWRSGGYSCAEAKICQTQVPMDQVRRKIKYLPTSSRVEEGWICRVAMMTADGSALHFEISRFQAIISSSPTFFFLIQSYLFLDYMFSVEGH